MAKSKKIIGEIPPPSPPCMGCGKPLAPQFRMVSEEKTETRLSDIPPPYTCHPTDEFLISKGYDPAEIDQETGLYVLRDRQSVTAGKRWLGYFGYDGNSLFCSKMCGYRWAVRELKSRRKDKT